MQPKKKQKLGDHGLLGYSSEDFIKSQFEELYSGLKQPMGPNSDQIRDCLLNLKPCKKRTIGEAVDAVKGKKSTSWPLPSCLTIPNGNFKFFPPVKVVDVGGVKMSVHLKSSPSSDLLLLLSEKFCEPKDYLNGRYIVKRTLFLVHLIQKLRICNFVSAVKFKYFNSDVLKPILHVQCTEGHSFNLIPCGSFFKPSLLKFDRNAIRPDKLYDTGVECSESSTPYYNNSILSDFYSPQYVTFMSVVDSSENFQQVLTILKYWKTRKGVRVSGHIMTTILQHLYEVGAVGPDMDVPTLGRQIWSYLSGQFIPAYLRGIVVGDCSKSAGFPGLYVDTSANVCYNTDLADLRELSRDAGVMTEMLNSREYNTFISVMSGRVSSLFDVYDEVFTVEVPEKCPPQSSLQYCGVLFRGFIDHLHSILRTAYTDRVKEIKIEYSLTEPWSRKCAPALPTSVRVGLSIDNNTWTRVVDRGPSADTADSETFRQFWGERSKVRRFQDGSIVAAVVWEGKTAQERRTILQQITEHVLARHAGVSPDRVRRLHLQSKQIVGRQYYQGDGEEQAQKIIQTFSELSKILRNCSKIPLSVTSVLGVAPALRNTELYPAAEYQVRQTKKHAALNLEEGVPPFVRAHDVVCHFELSGKWPEDVRAMLRLKAALYLALGEELQSQHIASRANFDFLDIARNGFVFRLRFMVPKEEKLRESNISFWVPCSGEELRVQTVILPTVSSHLTSLSLQHAAFPLTVRYLKQWVASHSLSNYIPDIFCELVVAHAFLTKSQTTPRTATAAFLRVLSFLSSFDWSLYPLFINFNEELSSETFELYQNFMISRRTHPDACIVCPQNEKSDLTRNSPSTSSLSIVKHFAQKTDISSLDSIFKPNLALCNIIIHLQERRTGRMEASELREHHARSALFPVVEYEPARLYVEELTSAYGEMCLFLYNKYCPGSVRVVLRRALNSEMKFTVNRSAAKTRSPSGAVRDNLDAMLSDFDLIGKGLVQNIEVVNLEV